MAKHKYIETPEVWKPISGFWGYEVSNMGRVRSYRKRNSTNLSDKPKLISLNLLKTHCKEYYKVKLRLKGSDKSMLVHRLVATEFLDNKEKKPQVHHKDNDGLNNNVNNLEWVTNSENQLHINRGKRKICRSGNSYRVYFSKGQKRTSKNFKTIKEAEEFRDSLN